MERITRRRITFPHPFPAGDLNAEHPPGTYEVELVEELVGLSFLAYRLVSASVVLPLAPGSHSYELVRIEPAIVRNAERDTVQEDDAEKIE
jgi:hypothetical protein